MGKKSPPYRKQKPQGKNRKTSKRFDPVLKNIFSGAVRSILSLAGFKVGRAKLLPVEIHITKTYRIDMLIETKTKIYHVEIQGYRDSGLPRRMFEYYFAIDLNQREEIRKKQRKKLKDIEQIVIWTGKGKPPPAEYRTKNTIHRYKVVDVKEISPRKFLRSENPYEVILALVVGKPQERVKILPRVLRRLQKISKSREEFIRYIEEITVVARLFGLEVGDKMDWMMKIIEETFPFKEGFKRGRREGRKEGLEKGREQGRQEGRKEGRREGEVKGLQEAILLDVKVRFGRDKVQLARPKIEKIKNIKKLKELKIRVLKAEDWEDFLKALNKNSRNSKKRSS